MEVAVSNLGAHAGHPVGRRRRLGAGVRGRRRHGRRAPPSTCARAPACSARYCDGLGVRSFPAGKDCGEDRAEPVLSAFAKHSGVPVVNLESPMDHPYQGLADAMTLRQRLARNRARAAVVLTWAPHLKALPMAVPNSVLLGASPRGRRGRARAPGGLRPGSRDRREAAGELARRAAGRSRVTDDPDAAPTTAPDASTRSPGARCADYGNPRRREGPAREARGLARHRGAHAPRHATRSSCTACPCAATSSSPTRSSTGRAASSSTRRRTASRPSRRSWSGWRMRRDGVRVTQRRARRKLACRACKRTRSTAEAAPRGAALHPPLQEEDHRREARRRGRRRPPSPPLARRGRRPPPPGGHPGRRSSTAAARRRRSSPSASASSRVLVDGRRVTDDATLDVVKMVFAGKINIDILSALRRQGVHAVGLSGVDGNIVLARAPPKKRVVNRETGKRELVDFGHVGDVVDGGPAPADDACSTPVTSRSSRRSPPTRRDSVFNVNADTVASAIAIGACGREADPAVRRPGRPARTAGRPRQPRLATRPPPRRAASRGARSVTGGMIAKLEASSRVAEAGVGAVHIVNGNQRNALLSEIFGDRGQRHDGRRGLTRRRDRVLTVRPPASCDRARSEFVSLPSVSGSEARLADADRRDLPRRRGVPRVDGRNVVARRGGRRPCAPSQSPISTPCPPVDPGGARTPRRRAIEGGRVLGLGTNDAKASVAAMLEAFLTVAAAGSRDRSLFAGDLRRGDRRRGNREARRRTCPSTRRSSASPTTSPSRSRRRGSSSFGSSRAGEAGHAARPHLADNAIVRVREGRRSRSRRLALRRARTRSSAARRPP